MTTDELFTKYAKAGKVKTTVKVTDERGQAQTFSIAGNCNDLSDADELVRTAQAAGANITRKGAFAQSQAKDVVGEDAAANLAQLLGVVIAPKKKRNGKPDTVPTETNGHTTEVS